VVDGSNGGAQRALPVEGRGELISLHAAIATTTMLSSTSPATAMVMANWTMVIWWQWWDDYNVMTMGGQWHAECLQVLRHPSMAKIN
jgi:hypothetical protein